MLASAALALPLALLLQWPSGDVQLQGACAGRHLHAGGDLDAAVPKGQDAMFQNIDLHGPVSIEFVEDMAQVSNGCGQELNARFAEFGSLRAAGGVEHRAGNYHYSTSQWEWHDEMYEHEDGRYPTGADPFGLGGDQ